MPSHIRILRSEWHRLQKPWLLLCHHLTDVQRTIQGLKRQRREWKKEFEAEGSKIQLEYCRQQDRIIQQYNKQKTLIYARCKVKISPRFSLPAVQTWLRQLQQLDESVVKARRIARQEALQCWHKLRKEYKRQAQLLLQHIKRSTKKRDLWRTRQQKLQPQILSGITLILQRIHQLLQLPAATQEWHA